MTHRAENQALWSAVDRYVVQSGPAAHAQEGTVRPCDLGIVGKCGRARQTQFPAIDQGIARISGGSGQTAQRKCSSAYFCDAKSSRRIARQPRVVSIGSKDRNGEVNRPALVVAPIKVNGFNPI